MNHWSYQRRHAYLFRRSKSTQISLPSSRIVARRSLPPSTQHFSLFFALQSSFALAQAENFLRVILHPVCTMLCLVYSLILLYSAVDILVASDPFFGLSIWARVMILCYIYLYFFGGRGFLSAFELVRWISFDLYIRVCVFWKLVYTQPRFIFDKIFLLIFFLLSHTFSHLNTQFCNFFPYYSSNNSFHNYFEQTSKIFYSCWCMCSALTRLFLTWLNLAVFFFADMLSSIAVSFQDMLSSIYIAA